MICWISSSASVPVAFDRDRLLAAGLEIARRDAHDAVRVDVERDLDLGLALRRRRMPASTNSPSRSFSSARLALALQHADLDRRLVVARGGEDVRLAHRHRGVALDQLREVAAEGRDAERERRHVEQQQVRGPRRRSASPWIAAPTATTSSGFTPLCGALAEVVGDGLLHQRHARLAADQDHLVDRPAASSPASLDAALDALQRLRRRCRATRPSSASRVSSIVRCRGPFASLAMNGRLISVELSAARGRTSPSPRRPSGAAAPSGRRAGRCPRCSWNCSSSVLDDAAVEVLAAQERVAGRREHLDHALAHLEDRDVEGAAAEVVDRDLLARSSCRSRRPAPPRSAR